MTQRPENTPDQLDSSTTAERHAAILFRLAQAVTSTIELTDLLDLVVEQVAKLVGADRASIWLIDEKNELLSSAAIFGVESEFAAQWRGEVRHWEDEPLSRLALANKEVIVVEDAKTDPRTDKGAVELFGDLSILVAPLIARGRTVGTLYLNHIREHHSYRRDELELIQAIAGQAAQAILNAELYSESKRQGEELQRSFLRIGAALASTVDFDETLRVIVGSAVEFLDASAGGLAISETPGAPMVIRAAHGADAKLVETVTTLIGGELESSVISGSIFEGEENLHSYLAVPLVGRAGVIGLLGVVAPGERGFDARATELLQTFAAQGAAAIEGARLYAATIRSEAEARGRADAYSRLSQIGTAINESLELETALEVIADSAKTLIGSDFASILIIEEDMGQRLAVSVPDGFRTPVRRNGLTNYVYRSGVIVVVPDSHQDNRVNPEVLERGIRSLVCVPLRVDGRVAGVLYLNSYEPRDYSSGTVALLEVLAGQAGVAIKNARLFRTVVQEKEKLGAIVENSSDGILLLNDDRSVVTANPALAEMTGWRTDETAGKFCYQVLGCTGDESTNCPTCPLSQSAAESGPHDLPGRNRAGRELTLAVTVGRVAPTHDEPGLSVAMIRDISASRRLEEAKAHFVSLISHELRTPLSLVKGYLSTLRRADELQLDAGRRVEYFVKAGEAADRLHRLIDDLLTATRLDAGVLNLHRQPIDLRDLARQEAAWCETLGVERPIQLDLPDEPVMVSGDRQRLEEVLHNLVDNAHKYSPPGSPIGIRLSRPDQSNTGCWLLAVRDQGPGLSADEAKHIFEKFYRGELAQHQASKGIGLGLAIVKGLVEAHGGSVWVESELGKGSVFYVMLPAFSPRNGHKVIGDGQ